ncbi:MAG: DUF3795 domain-containing protein [Bacteroidales bacterium]|nr:MAG: DUF3795 domain-containing protein [Bacteroidales bacterium]
MKMPSEIPESFFAPCGMNCMVCYVHLKEKKPCSGCLGDDQFKPDRCKACSIKNCAKEKGFTYCYECSDFPCKRINNLEKSYKKRYNTSLIENSKMVKERGIMAFQVEEQKKWKCSKCSGVISLHDKICSNCHNTI